jgi:hypothetical protein
MSWGDLNKRQQDYLTAVYEIDHAQEDNIKAAAARGRWNSTPASVWRWMPYNAAGASLLDKVESMGYRDRGTGSTFAALERRGLILCRYERDVLGIPILFVQITKAGRKLVRDALGLKAPKALPPGTLREWHWRALVHVYRAGEQGVEEWPRGIGHMTIRRLEEYRVKGHERPLIGYVKIPCEPYVRKRWPGDEGYLADVREVLRITAFGREYYRENWQRYRELYPDVEAPAPAEDEE